MPELDVSNPSIAYGVLGFYLTIVALVSYVVKNRLYLSGAVVALLGGVIVGPYALNWVSPLQKWAGGDEERFQEITFEISRVVIAVQVLFTGISLPKAYLRKACSSLLILLVPVLTAAWLVSSLLIWAFFPSLSFLESLVIGACVAPTDPVLASAVCKGRFAVENVPKEIRQLLAAESGANDGLGFPFLYFALYLLRRNDEGWSLGKAMSEWILNTWLYEIALSIVAGFIIGYIARKTLKFAEQRQYIEHESLFAYGVGLALLCCGTIGLLGSDDLLCAFIAGNALTWDDWYRLVSEDESFQDTIDNLLDTTALLYIGAILPWSSFDDAAQQQDVWRFVILGLLIMLVRRLPWVLATYRYVGEIRDWKEASFVGFFGPIGVSALYYIQVALMNLPAERARLRELISPIVLFLILTSVLIHGTSVSIARFSHRTYTRTKSVGRSGTSTPSRIPAPLAGTLSLPAPPKPAHLDDGSSVDANDATNLSARATGVQFAAEPAKQDEN